MKKNAELSIYSFMVEQIKVYGKQEPAEKVHLTSEVSSGQMKSVLDFSGIIYRKGFQKNESDSQIPEQWI